MNKKAIAYLTLGIVSIPIIVALMTVVFGLPRYIHPLCTIYWLLLITFVGWPIAFALRIFRD